MTYTREKALDLSVQCQAAWNDLLGLQGRFDYAGRQMALTNDEVEEHMRFGVARRFNVIGFALRNIYSIFPPERTTNLNFQEVADVEVNLHAFVINLSGAFDNMAWAFVLRHGLLGQIGHRNRVGMLQKHTRRFLPKAIVDQLDAPATKKWMVTYVMDYRDALAHRIPLYLPPSIVTREEAPRFSGLEGAKSTALREGNVELYQALDREQALIGRPSPFFLHSFRPAARSREMMLHPQVISDVRGLINFGALFLNHWHEVERGPNLNP